MSLVRHELRDELVTIIAAGRELPPDHDHILADIFLKNARALIDPQPQPATPTTWEKARNLVAAGVIGLAGIMFGALAFHSGDGDHGRATFNNQSTFVGPGGFDGDRDGFHNQWSQDFPAPGNGGTGQP
jgi:hypothetical protein